MEKGSRRDLWVNRGRGLGGGMECGKMRNQFEHRRGVGAEWREREQWKRFLDVRGFLGTEKPGASETPQG